MIDRIGVSTQELHFVELLQLSVPPSLAVQQAGIDEQATDVLKRPAVRVAIRERTYCEVHGILLPLSTKTIRDVLTNPVYPGGAKVAAVKLVWGAAGLLPTGQKPLESRPASGEDIPEGASVPALGTMENTLKEMQSRLAGMAAQLLRAEPIDVTPSAVGPVDVSFATSASAAPDTSFFDI